MVSIEALKLTMPTQIVLEVEAARAHVRLWPLADITARSLHVRYWGQSGHRLDYRSDLISRQSAMISFDLAPCR